MKVVQQLDERVWRDVVDRHPQGNIFHTPEMFQVFTRTKGHLPTLWATVDGSGDPLALLLPVQMTLMGGLLRRLTTRAIVYGGVLCASGHEGEEALAALLRVYKRKAKHSALFTELRNLSDLSTVQPVLQVGGFTYEDHLDYLIRLGRPVDEIMESIGARTRKNIRRGLRHNDVVIEEVKEPGQIPLCYDLLRQTYASAHVPLADCSLFEAAFDVLYPKGMIRFVLARVGDAYVGASVELLYKRIVYGWYGGVDRAYTRYSPNDLLTWHILQWSAEHGYWTYDFGGAGKPDEEYGVRDFKAKFGGDLVCYGRNTWVHAPVLFGMSRRAYAAYRRLL